MGNARAWAAYPDDYRRREVQILLDWVRTGVSGAVVGGPGSGKSNLLGFICHRPDVWRTALPSHGDIFLIPLDLNNLPVNDLSNLYRAILRACYEVRARFEDDLCQLIVSLFHEHRDSTDPFVAQSALREWLLRLRKQEKRVVLVVDRFDWFCQHASASMSDSLRGLRDSFKETLSFIAGTRHELRYFADWEALGELYELLDTFTCWIQPLEERHARQMIAQEVGGRQVDEHEVGCLLALSGGYPALLKTACHWLLLQPEPPPADAWVEGLRAFPAMACRLEGLWQSFTVSEQQALQSLLAPNAVPAANAQAATGRMEERRQRALSKLEAQGLLRRCDGAMQIRSELLAAHVGSSRYPVPGSLWLDTQSDSFYQGTAPLDNLSPLEESLLRYLLQHPQVRHTHTELIEAAWPEDTLRAGVSTEALYQVVRGLRRKIEPRPSRPRYIVNWRGAPEGGYRCFPEGMPA